MKQKFKIGDVIVFDPASFNPEYWNNLSEKDRKKYYGAYGYGRKKLKFFVFLTEINDAPGHMVIVSMDHGDKEKVITMAHTVSFRKTTEEEF